MFHTAAFHLWYGAESVDQKDYILVLFTSCFELSILYLGYLSCVDIPACRNMTGMEIMECLEPQVFRL
ncbi:hypothetical protein P3S68_008077 [Capsicum galapagoense]